MQYKHPVQRYTRAQQPPTNANLPTYLDEELKKIERSLSTIYEALKDIAAHVA